MLSIEVQHTHMVSLAEPVTGGNITGPSFTGTIVSGSAVVTATAHGKVANPFVQIFPHADDGRPFIATAQGVGAVGAQLARVVSSLYSLDGNPTLTVSQVVDIGGKYAALADEFILATFTDNDQNPPTESTIKAWIVSRSD